MSVLLFVLGIVTLYLLAAVNVVALCYTMIGLIDPGRHIKATFLYCFFAGLLWPIVGAVLVFEAMKSKPDKRKKMTKQEEEILKTERERMVKQYGDRLEQILKNQNN